MISSSTDAARLRPLGSAQGFWQSITAAPHAYDWFFVMRWIDAHNPALPRLGYAVRPSQEPLRISQQPALHFAASALFAVKPPRGRPPVPVLQQLSFGLFGPNGALPTHLTELAYERSQTSGDNTLASFADVFHHRAAMLFYRAWADAQSTASLDRPGEDSFSRYVDSFLGYRTAPQPQQSRVPSAARRHAAGHWVRHVRNPEGIVRTLQHHFGVPVQLHEWRFGWLAVAASERTGLAAGNRFNALGVNAFAGARVPDRQHRFRLAIGPMRLCDYENLLPGTGNFLLLIDWLRDYVGVEFDWDVQLVLKKEEAPGAALGRAGRLGWTSWLGNRAGLPGDADDLVLHPERSVAGPGFVH